MTRFHEVCKEAIAIEAEGEPDEAIDHIMQSTDVYLNHEKPWSDLDDEMPLVPVEELSPTLCVTVLMMTRTAHAFFWNGETPSFPNRPALVARIRKRLEEVAPGRVEALMTGLEK